MSAMSALSPSKDRWQPQKMVWWYWALMDEMIASPDRALKDIANDFKVTPAAVYLITGSDLFKAHLAARRRDMSERIDGAIAKRLGDVALKSLDIIGGILETKQEAIGVVAAVDIMDKTLGRLGYGPKGNGHPSIAVQVNGGQANVVVPVSPADLDAAREALRRSEQSRLLATAQQGMPDSQRVIEGEVVSTIDPPSREE